MNDTPLSDASCLGHLVPYEVARSLEIRLTAAQAEIARLRKDAERYRHLRDLSKADEYKPYCMTFVHTMSDFCPTHGYLLDRAVDESMEDTE